MKNLVNILMNVVLVALLWDNDAEEMCNVGKNTSIGS